MNWGDAATLCLQALLKTRKVLGAADTTGQPGHHPTVKVSLLSIGAFWLLKRSNCNVGEFVPGRFIGEVMARHIGGFLK